MSRPLTLGNGSLHVGLNERALVSDFYYPHVGQENHVAGDTLHHRIGVWADGAFSWLEDDGWAMSMRREPHANIGVTSAVNQRLDVRLEFTDTVYSADDCFIRGIQVFNLSRTPREIRVFMHQVFAIGDSRSNTDTAQYLPENDAVLHYRGRRAFVIGGRTADGRAPDGHSIGLYGIEGHEGTFRDAEDGMLGGNDVEHGRVDSVLGFTFGLGAHDSGRVDYWIACGQSAADALKLHERLRTTGARPFLVETAAWWKDWLAVAEPKLASVAPRYHQLFRDSLMILRSHADADGAIIASTDTTMLNYARDAYAYCWPRDGAYATWPLIRLGYTDEPLGFFRFIARVIHAGGYVMHKYFADGSLGPSWHPYVHGGVSSAPIQEDETATVLFMLAEFIGASDGTAILEEFYEPLVRPMADFLCGFIDSRTGLPKPSYDLWEEVFATSTYTVAAVYGALQAAADLADRHAQASDALRWRTEAETLGERARGRVFNAERGFFYKGFSVDEAGTMIPNPVIDSASLYGVLTYGLFAADSEQVTAAVATLTTVLGTASPYDGIARYEDDNYDRNADSGVGNPWFITSLWQAQAALYAHDYDRADRIIGWVAAHADSTGTLAEQADRATGAPLSVAPLVWSHAEFLNTVLDRGVSS